MNCTELFVQQARIRPKAIALSVPGVETVTFGELLEIASRAQVVFRKAGAKPGVSVLVLDQLGVRLYASIIALLSLGASVILVEPWMPVPNIQRAIENARPGIFLAHWLGFVWGTRVRAIRDIPEWINISSVNHATSKAKLHLENVPSETLGILTFTSGTTGTPKGVVRKQGYLVRQHEVLSQYLMQPGISGTDLCIFANFVLSNLASGRGSVLVPPSWNKRFLQKLDYLPPPLQPVSLTCGPAFLNALLENAKLPSLRSIHVGGAQTDCDLFERAFEHWPKAHWTHIYGGSEVEPVALVDARKSVRRSRERGLFQTLFLGENVPEIKPKIQSDGLWVAGPHVCPEYLGNDGENERFKRKDADGRLWHCMGDRITTDESGWWYMGRSAQSLEEFQLEQRIYSRLQSSRSFVAQQWLVGEGLKKRKKEILSEFPELKGVAEARIYRDRRHRARIDRNKTLKKGTPWLVG